MRYPVVLQHDATDCGPAALATVAAFHKKRCSLAAIREAAHTDRQGTSIAGIIAAAERVGFDARGVRASFEALPQAALPAIAHWREGARNHFVVLFKVRGRRITIGDPAQGLRRLDVVAFRECWTGVLVLLSPAPRLKEHLNQPRSFVRLCRFLLPHRRLFLDALLAAVLMTLLSLSTSFFIQALVDFVFVLGRKPALNWLSLGMLAVLFARTVFQGLRTYLLAHLSLRIDADTVLGFHRHLLELPLAFFLRRKTGEILSRINDAVKIRVAISAATLSIIVDALLVLTTAAVMLWLDWRLASAGLALCPLIAFIVWLINKPMKRYQRLAMEKASELEAQIVETVGAIQSIKACRAEARMQLCTEARFDEVLDASFRSQMLALGAGLTSSFAIGLSGLALLWFGGRQVLMGALSVGQLMSFYSLLGAILAPVERLSNSNQTILDAVVAADRLGEILDLDTETGGQRPNAVDRRVDGHIVFDDVTCRYGVRSPVIEGFSLSIHAGECLGIDGKSGSGKTTLVNLLARFIEPTAGRVTLDGIDIQDYALGCLRREIVYVPQDIVLLNGSIADNIRMGNPAATAAEVRKAGRLARVDEFAQRLSFGYDTLVGERGLSLSGGERQRVALARAILLDPAVLVLDEPTSHLDAPSERAVQDLIDSRSGRRTTIVISHRPLRLDRVIHLEDHKFLSSAAVRA
jgi:ABC-type bacteriocin/lantibiotic exporter with double-glycine peptidase domain